MDGPNDSWWRVIGAAIFGSAAGEIARWIIRMRRPGVKFENGKAYTDSQLEKLRLDMRLDQIEKSIEDLTRRFDAFLSAHEHGRGTSAGSD